MLRLVIAASSGLALASAALAQDTANGPAEGPYAGLQDREIAGLSEDDIAELRRGGGWGLALPAELNGVPGPAHLLELSEELDLSDDQVAEIRTIHEEMRSEAVVVGDRLIAAEAALTDAFHDGRPDPDTLSDLIASAEAARARLRLVHLSRHLATPPILSDDQMRRYSILRGYADDPCEAVPDGHDETLWRRHNGCA